MAANFVPPLERAWERTRGVLLRPFRLERWLVIAFAAFLADLGSGGWSKLHLRLGFPPRFDHYVDRPMDLYRDVLAGPLWLWWAFPLLLAGIAIGLALLWISSHGKFVFLDCMLHGRAQVWEPWRRYSRQGNSLFLWRVGYVAVLLLAFGVLLGPMLAKGHELGHDNWTRPAGAATVAAAALLMFAVAVVLAGVALFTESFVVPLMYRDGIGALDGWRVFLPLLRANLADFVVYGLAVFAAFIALAFTLMLAAIVTCCIAPLLLVLPFVNVALLLPLYGVFRLYSVEFLAQFGPDWVVGPPETAPPPQSSSS